MQDHIPDVGNASAADAAVKELLGLLRDGKAGGLSDASSLPGGEGPLEFTVAAMGGQIVMDFGKPIELASLSVHQARYLARGLREQANIVEREARGAPKR